MLNQDREGKLIAGGTTRLVALVVPAKHGQTGQAALLDIREFYASPGRYPVPTRPGSQPLFAAKPVCKVQVVSPAPAASGGRCRKAAVG
jgi:hypothetical protein